MSKTCKVGVRRTGFDFRARFFGGVGLECLGEDSFPAPLSLLSVVRIEVPVFDEASIFDDVCASVGESCVRFRSELDVRVTFFEVEVGCVANRRLFVELDEGMMMRSVEVLLSLKRVRNGVNGEKRVTYQLVRDPPGIYDILCRR